MLHVVVYNILRVFSILILKQKLISKFLNNLFLDLQNDVVKIKDDSIMDFCRSSIDSIQKLLQVNIYRKSFYIRSEYFVIIYRQVLAFVISNDQLLKI
jgi:hypothetical protein